MMGSLVFYVIFSVVPGSVGSYHLRLVYKYTLMAASAVARTVALSWALISCPGGLNTSRTEGPKDTGQSPQGREPEPLF